MKKQKKNITNYGIVGLGRFGMALALELANSGANMLVIDKDESKVREMRDHTENAFVVSGLDKKTLSETGIANCDIAVVCIAEHIDTSILTVLNLVSLGVPKVIAKAQSTEHGEILEKLGAEVVYPEHDMAVRLANRLEASRMLDFVQLTEKLNISKFVVPDSFVGKTVAEIEIRKKYGLNIIALESGDKTIENVVPNYVFSRNDIMFVSGTKESINNFYA